MESGLAEAAHKRQRLLRQEIKREAREVVGIDDDDEEEDEVDVVQQHGDGVMIGEPLENVDVGEDAFQVILILAFSRKQDPM